MLNACDSLKCSKKSYHNVQKPIPLLSSQLSTNQKAAPAARAQVECGTLCKIQNFTQFPPSPLPVFIYLNLSVKPGHFSQET